MPTEIAETPSSQMDGILGTDYLDAEAPQDAAAVDDAVETQEESASTEAEQPQQQAQTTQESPLDKRITELAKKRGLNPEDPAVRAFLTDMAKEVGGMEKRLGDKDSFIGKLQSKLTPLEEEVYNGVGQQPGQQQQVADQQQQFQQQPQAADDPWGHWRNGPEDAGKELLETMSKAHETGDYRPVGQVLRGIVAKGIQAHLENIDQRITAHLQNFERERLGEFLPAVRETVSQQRERTNMQAAQQQLVSSDPGWKDVLTELHKPLSQETLEFDGGRFADTWMNRIARDNPYILDINVNHPDPNKAQMLTHIARMRAFQRELSKVRTSPQQAKELIATGAAMAKKETTQQRARQAVLAGGSAGSGPKPAAKGDYIAELQSNREKGTSLRDYI